MQLTLTRRLIMQKARGQFAFGPKSKAIPPTACRHTVSGSISLPARGSFHLSLTVLVRYRSPANTQPWKVVLPDSHGISRVPRYLGIHSREPSSFRLLDYHLLWSAFPGRSARTQVDNSPTRPYPGQNGPHNPGHATRTGLHAARFGLVPVRSPLLGKSRLLSFPGGTEMFQFPPSASTGLFDSAGDGAA